MKLIKYTLIIIFLCASSIIAYGQYSSPATQPAKINQAVSGGPSGDPAQPGGVAQPGAGITVPLDSSTMLMLLAGFGVAITLLVKPKKTKESRL